MAGTGPISSNSPRNTELLYGTGQTQSERVSALSVNGCFKGLTEQHKLRQQASTPDSYAGPRLEKVNLSANTGADSAANSPLNEQLDREYRAQAAAASRTIMV